MWPIFRFRPIPRGGSSAISRPLQTIIAALIVALSAVTALPPPLMAHSQKDLESALLERERYVELTDFQAPDFTLTDPTGATVSLSDLGRKVVVLYFVYARCKELCPLQNDFIALIQEQLNTTPMRDLVQFVTVVTDTEDAQETAEILKGFPRRHGFDTVNWTGLYRGSLEPTAAIDLAAKYGQRFDIIVTDDGEPEQVHAVVTHLIDREGVVRARYHGLYFEPVNFISHINALLHDAHETAASVQAPEPSWWETVRSWF